MTSASEPTPANDLRSAVRRHYLADERQVIRELIARAGLDAGDREAISARAARLVETVRASSDPTMMESFLGEYGLSTKEGVALMCLAEALLRVPDEETIDDLIEDKISVGKWSAHLGHSNSTLVNASTWALMITGSIVTPSEEEGLVSTLWGMVRRLGEPVIRKAVGEAMKELGRQFVLGRTIEEAVKRASNMEERGYCYSYDMLGEAARTEADARRYHLSYSDAITALAPACKSEDIRANPGISVKLSALHARYEYAQRDRVLTELASRARSLALLAKSANMGLNIDAEEADRLDLSLDVIETVLSDPALAGWDGFGVVVQAFGPRAAPVLDWLYDLARRLDRRIMVRLVKGAYWDTEIKRAQVLGLDGYPVFTRKANTDVSYIACARKLLSMTDRIYPQFATHNAHSVAAILHLGKDRTAFEFQRLHGMGEALHDSVLKDEGTRCRIYAPVGAHQDLLAYLVRRLLENGANSSFVNQIVDESISPDEIARDPISIVEGFGEAVANPNIPHPSRIFGDDRLNAKGWDVTDPLTVGEIDAGRERFRNHVWSAGPMIDGAVEGGASREVRNPANPADMVGSVQDAAPADVEKAIEAARAGAEHWSGVPASERGQIVARIGDLYEEHAEELFALAAREAGKIMLDCVGEVREAVDFTRYYANEAVRHEPTGAARGVITCISPWNFPLAIFTGQIAAALAAGNAVLAKPAEQTSLIAARAVELMHEAGVPKNVIQLLPGSGKVVGAALVSSPDIAGVCFTGSTATAQSINRAMADNMSPDAPLIAETGGLNAMIVDSTALPEQAVRDIVASAFQSAGQRCSALRVLYVQKDVEAKVLGMLYGAMKELRIGDPWALSTDIGPVIDEASRRKIQDHCDAYAAKDRLLLQLPTSGEGRFVGPAVLKVDGIEDLDEEIFGPVLHVATFEADQIDEIVDRINAKGYGLTFGLHTRVDDRVDQIVDRIAVGNIYVNRNQIGAVVGSQPFGGEGLSGTGPKAGGPHYVGRFRASSPKAAAGSATGPDVAASAVQAAIDALDTESWSDQEDRSEHLAGVLERLGRASHLNGVEDEPVTELPGPTGELNRLSIHPRGTVLCLGPGADAVRAQAIQALAAGNGVICVLQENDRTLEDLVREGLPVALLRGGLAPEVLSELKGFDAVCCSGDGQDARAIRKALAAREGMLVPMITEWHRGERYVLERHLCVDTTAAGGNATLLALNAD